VYSSMQGLDGFFGRGWMTLFDQQLTIEPQTGLVRFITADHEIVAFDTTLTQVWPKNSSVPDTLTMDTAANEAVYRRAGSSTETRFSLLDGHFAGVRDVITGQRMTITPTTGPGDVLTGWVATDSLSGITWTVAVTDGLVQTVTATSGLAWTYEYNDDRNLTRVAGPGGDTWRTYEYAEGLMTAARDAAGKLIESHTYDPDGHAAAAITPLEDITSIQYALAGPTADSVITRVTPAGATPTDITLRDIGGAYRPVDHDGTCRTCGARNEVVVRDGLGRVLRRQDADGYVTVYTYTNDHVTQIKSAMRPAGCDPAVSSTQCKLTTTALATALLDDTNATLTLDYEFQNTTWPDKPTKITSNSVYNSPNTRRETITYDDPTGQALTRVIKGWTANPITEETRTITATLYNGTEGAAFPLDPPLPSGAQPKLPKTIDGPRTDVDDVTTFAYYPFASSVPSGARGHLAATKDAMGHVTRFENYDLFGNPRKVTDLNGVITEITTDSIGRILTRTVKGVVGCDSATDPICGTDLVTTLTYDGFGPLKQEQRPGGGISTFEYDDRGRPVKVSRGPSASNLQEQIETVYDTNGRVSAHRYLARSGTWVEKRRADYTYDADGQLDKIIYPDTKFVQYTYDKAGRVKGTKDENHTTPNKTYLYDASGRIHSVQEKLGSGTVSGIYAYDAHGNLISATDPNGNVTSWVFDDFGQRLKETSPVSGVTTNTYGLGGELLTTTDARSITTTRAYDALGRIVSSISGGVSAESVSWSYDSEEANGQGRLSEMSDPAGATTYHWTRTGQLASESRVDSRDSGSNEYVTAYQYDVDGNRRHITYPQIPLTKTLPHYTPTTVAYVHDYAGREISATVNDLPFINSATYLPFGGLTSVAFASGLNISRTYDQRYRVDLNELSKAGVTIAKYDYDYDGTGNVTAIADVVSSAYDRTFGYDDLNRVVTANSGSSLWGSGSYAYDAMGNMLSTTLGPLTRTFSYLGTTSKLASVVESSSVPPGSSTSQTVSHDAAGNETTDSLEEYSVRNRMQASEGRSYAYDGRGIRVREDEGAVYALPPLRRYWFYSPELTLLATTGYADTTNLPVSRTFVWFAGMPVAQLDGTTLRHTFSDHLGTPLLQTNNAGTVLWRAEYEPFGKVWSIRAGALADQPLRFPGQEEAGNAYYNVFRWYRPDWGRYLSVDAGPAYTVDPQSWNRYSYARNSPLLLVDPNGRENTAYIINAAGAQNFPPALTEKIKAAVWGTRAEGKVKFVGPMATNDDVRQYIAKADATDAVALLIHSGPNDLDGQPFGALVSEDARRRFHGGADGTIVIQDPKLVIGGTEAGTLAQDGSVPLIIIAGCTSINAANTISSMTGSPALGTTNFTNGTEDGNAIVAAIDAWAHGLTAYAISRIASQQYHTAPQDCQGQPGCTENVAAAMVSTPSNQ
ncbi:MAG: hypothetical protein JOZ54_12075, partial [Acidobacteria bacterium]|nr:hypothetical protein [Acidobacteriota bacterium]